MVRFSDTDPFSIAHYPRIVDKIHETSDMFMQEIGYPFWEIYPGRDILNSHYQRFGGLVGLASPQIK